MGGTKNLKHQHDGLHTGVAAMAAIRDRFEELDRDTQRAAIGRTLEFLRHEVEPHARAEESVLYPEVGRLLNFHLSGMLVHQHRRIDQLVADLSEAHSALAARGDVASNAADTLWALITLMRSHLLQEEEVLLTMLDQHLSSAEADALYERMEEATRDAASLIVPPTVPRDRRLLEDWRVFDLPIATEARSRQHKGSPGGPASGASPAR
jgi:hemerythrin-like domain-containing protein